MTDAGDDYDALNETYVIFITENDVLKAGLPIYHVDRTIRETGTFFNDQAHIVYVNSQIKDETALGKLMHDFFCTNSKDMNYSILAQRVRYFKEDRREWQLCAELWKRCGMKPSMKHRSNTHWQCWQMVCLVKRWQSTPTFH